MKKQNNIWETIKNIIYLTFVCAFLNACTDEEIYKPSTVKEGIPVEINFGISTPEMDKITTRSVSESGESQVNDLYVLVFDKEGTNLKTSKFYDIDDIVSSLENKSKGTLTLKTTSGESRIYAIANSQTTELNGVSIRGALDKVTSVEELFKVTAALKDGNIERMQASLTMSGTFEQDGVPENLQKLGYCIIPEKSGTIQGKVYLSRLDSHITFKIATASNVSFTPTSWQVKYVPLKSTVIAQEKNLFTSKDEYADSKTYTGFGTTEENNIQYRTFDFYMMENIKNAIFSAKDGTMIATDVSNMTLEDKKAEYAKREKEIKTKEDKDGKVQNTGIYEYSEEYATYVEIKGSLEIKLNDGNTRIATVTYAIHLGGGISNPSNFISKRNTKYTYLMKINDVEDIVIEVTEKNERRPGAEGDVVDSKTGVRTLDAHYNYFIMGFSYRDVAGEGEMPALKFVVKTPFGEVTQDNTPDDADSNAAQQDYHWIHFKSHSSKNDSTTLQSYTKEGLIDLFGLAEDVMQRYSNDKDRKKNKDKKYYYTVYIDEYYYTKAPKGKESEWGDEPDTYWHHFANKDNRYVMLVYAPEYSKDGESSYARAQYMVTQRSIQTYYSTESKTALGMEHKNETGYGKWGIPNIANDMSSANGLWNTWVYLKKNKKWNAYVTPTIWNEEENTFATLDKAIVLARCLSRNRDEDGNGEISESEMKWYVPASEQLMGMYLGAESLPSPLFDANNITYDHPNRVNYHYATSDKKRIWSEEGGSVGDFDHGYDEGEKTPKNFRCVRNLGMDKTPIAKDSFPGQAFEYMPTARIKLNGQTVLAERIFSMTKLTEQNIRGGFSRGEIGLHNNFDNNNKPSKSFQMSSDKMNITNKYSDKTPYDSNIGENVILSTWNVIIRSYWYDSKNYLTTNHDYSKCIDYTENNGLDRGEWRAPTQREMMLMYIQDKNNVTDTFSRTKSKYNEKRQFGVDNNNLRLSEENHKNNWSIRCVRDVELVK